MLNEPLYRAMTRLFGEPPHIVNEGMAATIKYPPPIISYIPTITPISSRDISGGEQYTVNCPFCKDQRHRLYISHMWNARLVVSGQTYAVSDRLIRCFNEECQREQSNRDWIINNLNSLLGNPVLLDSVDIQEREQDICEISNQVPLPQNLCDIMDKEVPQYMRDYWFNIRKFSVETLRHFGIKFTLLDHPIRNGNPPMKQWVTIIPVFQNNEYWFYQARLVPINGDPRLGYEKTILGEEYPKYHIPHGAKKSWSLYNLDNAEKYEEIAIVEGPTDVWRIGDRAVAKFGRSLSAAQRGILQRKFAKKSLLLVPDSDDPLAYEEGLKDKMILENTGQFKQVRVTRLPLGKDPGDLEGSADEIWKFLKENIDLPDTTLSSLSGIQVSL